MRCDPFQAGFATEAQSAQRSIQGLLNRLVSAGSVPPWQNTLDLHSDAAQRPRRMSLVRNFRKHLAAWRAIKAVTPGVVADLRS